MSLSKHELFLSGKGSSGSGDVGESSCESGEVVVLRNMKRGDGLIELVYLGRKEYIGVGEGLKFGFKR